MIALTAARPPGLILILSIVLAAGPPLAACSEGGSTIAQGAVIGSDRGATGIYSGYEWEVVKRNTY